MARLLAGIGELHVSARPDDAIVALSLGSCVVIICSDPRAGVTEMANCILPERSLAREHDPAKPAVCVARGFPTLMERMKAAGARELTRAENRLKVKFRQHGIMTSGTGIFSPGRRGEWREQLPAPVRLCAELLSDGVEYAGAQSARATRLVVQAAPSHEPIGRLAQLPGSGRSGRRPSTRSLTLHRALPAAPGSGVTADWGSRGVSPLIASVLSTSPTAQTANSKRRSKGQPGPQ